ncbi:MAG: InlB B-repeat-containing protein [Prevotella sp.]|nr:InlB B-repeat-containing protein [Prevotella sp.]
MRRKLYFILVLLLTLTQGAWAWTGSGTNGSPYLIASTSDWNTLATNVNNGTNYSGTYFRLTNDINVTTMVGNSESNSFRGTFDGDGHTLTINYSNNSDFTAPFRYIQGATFKNLKVTGSITTTMNLAAGIAGLNTGSTATFEQCVTDITFNSSSTTEVGWGAYDYHGGFLARSNSANVNLTDCVCGGSVNGSSSTQSKSAGFVGVVENGTVTGTRCLSTTSYTNVTSWNSLCHTAANAYRSASVFYYVNGNDEYGNVGEQITTSQLADGSIFTALEAGCAESVWAQDPITNQPMLKLFANDGKLPGEFTINAGGGKVHFSRGNLQYQASTNTWRFADNQYDNIGNNNQYISSSYSGWIDLFGWGTSGYNHGAVCYQPWSASTTNTDYYPYGSATANLYDGDGKADWGYNAISNGGNTENYGWRTPMKEEWVYLFNTRTTTSGIRYAKATVNGVTGVILLPDDWDASYYALNNTNTANVGWSSNPISASDWTASLEAHGAVFLPTSGNRDGANPPSSGFVSCWSSNYEVGQTNNALLVYIPYDAVYPDARGQRSTGNPVRLVYEPPYFQGAGTEADPYLISSEADWNYLAGKVNTGYTFSGKYFRQTADISVTTMVGNSESNSFRGTFDGVGHTLTFTKGSSESAFNEESCAPFRHVKNATITNLQVAGTIYTSAMRASGLVATSHGALTLAGCRSSVNINSSKSGDGTHGGLVAITTGSGNNVTIGGCVFDGSFATTSSTNSCGGFVGWTGENTSAITNSLMKPGCVAAGMLNNTFARWQSGYKPTITNCYYVTTDNLPTDQGKLARSISASDDVIISNLGDGTEYDVSGITAYAHGIKYNDVYYAGNGEEVSLTLSHGDAATGYTFNQYTVTGGGTLANPTTNSPTLTMTDANQTINAEWTANTYTVTLDQQGGTGGSDNVTATYNSDMPSATMPTRAHYTFGGYYTLTDGGGTQYYTAEGASARTWDIASATTLYAKWTAAPTATVSAPTAKSLTYDGTAQALVNAGTSSDGEIQYKLGDGSWDTSIPTATNAGTYTVYYKVVADNNHTDNAGSSVGVTISPASVTLTANSDTKAYNGEKQTVTGFTSSVEGLTFEGVSASGSGTTTGNYGVTFTGVTVNETKDATNNYVVTGTTNGTLTIETAVINYGAATITWNENGKTATFDGTSLETISNMSDIAVDAIVLNRTFSVSKPATIMLPFTISANKISGATFYTFSGVTKPADKWIATMTEVNQVTGTLEANTPYLVVPTGTALTFTGGATLNTAGGGNQQTADVGSHWTFKGTYAYKEWITNGANSEEIGKAYGFAGVQNTGIEVGDFVKVASGAKIRPMGCYLLWSDTPNASSAPARKTTRAANIDELPSRITVLLVSANGETTGIGELNTATGEISLDSWYSIDGVKLSGKPAKKGLYIHNGNKVIIK